MINNELKRKLKEKVSVLKRYCLHRKAKLFDGIYI